MTKAIKLLDCTLRDGAYITGSRFGEAALRGIIKKLRKAHIDIIECGWLKDSEYEIGTSFFHIPSDMEPYIETNDGTTLFCAMIDWDRYNTLVLPQNDGKTIDAIRVVFPHGKCREGIEVGKKIRERGYKVLFQAANTLAYSDDELIDLCNAMNEFNPISVSIVDTFGSMYFDDLDRIMGIMNDNLNTEIEIGFHAHNNQQLAFALAIHFADYLSEERNIIIDATLSGMGRGAGNATTELVASFLDRRYQGHYDLNPIMDAIDVYMQGYRDKYVWGYSTSYFIAGLYQCHVNNIAYLQENHRTNARDMRNIIASMSSEERRKYDYDLLEQKYIENQSRVVEDEAVLGDLEKKFSKKMVVLLAPGKSLDIEEKIIKQYISDNDVISVAVNAINPKYKYDYLFFVNSARYEYAKNAYPQVFMTTPKIILSNIKTNGNDDESIVCFNHVIKRGWKHFDNSVITCLRLMRELNVKNIAIAGFDGFKYVYGQSYSDENLPSLNPGGKWSELNEEIKEIYRDFYEHNRFSMNIKFLTESIYEIK